MMKKQNTVELLAPAGSKDSFYAAIAYGANAVYLGIEAFNARMGAENIQLDELPDFVDYAHRRNVKVYVTLNTLIRDDEWKQLEQVVEALVIAGVDAVILQDLGVLTYIQATYPELECHASTQFSVYDAEGVRRAKELGFSRVVIARETSVDEIERCALVEGIELEVFVHGALCVSASGQCLFSSMRGGRSGNRGRCAQPCRLTYSFVEAEGKSSPWLSLKDLCGMEALDRLMKIGVHSLKIEGRSKRPAYVAGVIRSYREAIDGQIDHLDQRLDEMKRLFYRGFTEGLLNEQAITEIGSLDQPNHQGVEVGKILQVDGGKAMVRSRHEFVSGDGIRYRDEKGQWVGQNLSWVQKKGADRYWIRLKQKPSIAREIFLTKDHALERSFSWAKTPIEPWMGLNGHCAINVGEKLRLVVHIDGETLIWQSEEPIEPAKTRGSKEEEVRKHLTKLGNTPFYWEGLEVELDAMAYVPARLINAVRRQMEMDLWARKEKKIPVRKPSNLPVQVREKKSMGFTLAVYGKGIGEKIDVGLYERIWILPELEEEAWVARARKQGVQVGWTYLHGQKVPIGHPAIELNDWNQEGRKQAYCGPNLFPMNRWTVKRLGDLGAKQIHLSTELSLEQIGQIAEASSLDLEVLGYGRIPLMSMRHCPMKAAQKCKGQNCSECSRTYHLIDGEGRNYPVIRKGQYGYLLSDQALSSLADAKDLEIMGIASLRMQFWNADEPVEAIQEWIRKWKASDWTSKSEMEAWNAQNNIKGEQRLLKRGVL